MQVCVCAHVCMLPGRQGDLLSKSCFSGDESKAKFRFKSHHRGQEGFPGLTWLSAVCSRMGWQAGGSQQPVSGESFVVSRPLGPAATVPGVGDPECSSDNHMPIPGAGGRKGPGIPLRLPCAVEKQREKRQEPRARKKPRHFLAWMEREGPGKK